MKRTPLIFLFIVSLFFSMAAQSQQAALGKTTTAETAISKSDEEQKKKASEWTTALQLNDPEKELRVQQVIATHLKSIRDWNNEHPFTTVPPGINPVTGNRLSDLDRQVIANSAMPKSVHDSLMSGL